MNNNELPSVAAVDTAFKAAAIWDKGVKTAAFQYNRTVYLCKENDGYLVLSDMKSGQVYTLGYRSCEGANSVIALAKLLDHLSQPQDVDYALGVELAGEMEKNSPLNNSCADEKIICSWACGFANGRFVNLPRAPFAAILAMVAYGLPIEDAIEQGKLLNENEPATVEATRDALNRGIDEMSRQCAAGWEEAYEYDPSREV